MNSRCVGNTYNRLETTQRTKREKYGREIKVYVSKIPVYASHVRYLTSVEKKYREKERKKKNNPVALYE